MSDVTVAILSPGNMGAAIGARLVANGIRVVTTTGRSAATEKRAIAAGIEMIAACDLRAVDFIFSIVPPDRAVANASTVAAALKGALKAPVFIDWNAIGVADVMKIHKILAGAGVPFVDGSIIGLPPTDDKPGATLYASGPSAAEVVRLNDRGVRFSILSGPIGAASALKLSYAGITKGLIALGSAMFLAAQRAGADEALLKELSLSQPNLFASFGKSIPDMFSKSRRWAPELEAIAEFVGADRPESGIYSAVARFYEALGHQADIDGKDIRTLKAMTMLHGDNQA
jgi:3-hydroxyisobutyrate dehydrogenase-like beta-hydroxyacid dehydrogenase